MSHRKSSRNDCPWYVSRDAVDDWKTVQQRGGDLKMLKTLKLVRSIIVNLGVISIAILALQYGAEPTLVATLSILVLGAYNGVEYSDYQALIQAIAEVRGEQQPPDTDSDTDNP